MTNDPMHRAAVEAGYAPLSEYVAKKIDTRTLIQRLQDEPDPLPARSGERIMREQNEQIEALRQRAEVAEQSGGIMEERITMLLERCEGYVGQVKAGATMIAELRAQLATAREDGARMAIEAAAKVAEGDIVKEKYRTWPHWNPNGNLANDGPITQLALASATAIRALNPASIVKGE